MSAKPKQWRLDKSKPTYSAASPQPALPLLIGAGATGTAPLYLGFAE